MDHIPPLPTMIHSTSPLGGWAITGASLGGRGWVVRWLPYNILPQRLEQALGLLQVNAEPICGKQVAWALHTRLPPAGPSDADRFRPRQARYGVTILFWTRARRRSCSRWFPRPWRAQRSWRETEPLAEIAKDAKDNREDTLRDQNPWRLGKMKGIEPLAEAQRMPSKE